MARIETITNHGTASTEIWPLPNQYEYIWWQNKWEKFSVMLKYSCPLKFLGAGFILGYICICMCIQTCVKIRSKQIQMFMVLKFASAISLSQTSAAALRSESFRSFGGKCYDRFSHGFECAARITISFLLRTLTFLLGVWLHEIERPRDGRTRGTCLQWDTKQTSPMLWAR